MEEQQPTTPKTGGNQMKVGLALVGLIVIAFIGLTLYQSQNKSETNTSQQTSPVVTEQQQPTAAVEATGYKDGTYTAVGNYTSPGGEEELGVTVTLASGVITDSTVEVKATRPISKTRQTDFAEHYKEMVVGKNIDEVELGKVSGSSLSPKGFNDALAQIKTEAKS